MRSEHIEAARVCANRFNRPSGINGPTPDEGWLRRTPIDPAKRDEFFRALERARSAGPANAPVDAVALGPPISPSLPSPSFPSRPSAGQRSSVDRAAISVALVELGYLLVRRSYIMSTHSDPKNGKDYIKSPITVGERMWAADQGLTSARAWVRLKQYYERALAEKDYEIANLKQQIAALQSKGMVQ